jgi:hypothetical protein
MLKLLFLPFPTKKKLTPLFLQLKTWVNSLLNPKNHLSTPTGEVKILDKDKSLSPKELTVKNS